MTNIFNMDYKLDDEWCFEAYKQFIKKEDKVFVIAFSFRDSEITDSDDWDLFYSKVEGKYYNNIIESYLSFGINENNIRFANYFKENTESIIETIEDSNILFLPGGMPIGLYDKVMNMKLLETIANFEGVIIGCSAGAMIQMDEYFISPDKDYPEYTLESGLGLVSGFGIEAHYSESDVQKESINKYIATNQNDVYAIGDKGMVIIEDDTIKTVGDVTIFKYGKDGNVRAGTNEKKLRNKIDSKNLLGKIVFGSKKKGKANISVDGHFIFNGKLYLVEVDSANEAKLLAGQYTLIDTLYDKSDDNITKQYKKESNEVVFLVIHFYKAYNPDRTTKNLKVIQDKFETKLEYKVFHYNDFTSWEDLCNKLK